MATDQRPGRDVSSTSGHAEALRVPLRWWALATMFLASILLAFLVATPAFVAFAGTAVLVALTVLVFWSFGSACVEVDGEVFRAGRAQIPVALLAEPVALDRDQTRRIAGVDADARAYLLLRPYVATSVRVTVVDTADPTPYWLVSTRLARRSPRASRRARNIRATLIAAPLTTAQRMASRISMSGSAGSVGGVLPPEPSFHTRSTTFLTAAVTPRVARIATRFWDLPAMPFLLVSVRPSCPMGQAGKRCPTPARRWRC